MPSGQHDKRPGNNPDQKHHKNIDTDNASDQHQHIRDHLHQMIRLADLPLHFCLKGQNQD